MPHITDALPQVAEVTRFASDLAVLECQSHQEPRPQRSDGEASLPVGEFIARVEGHAGGP
jgi:hypothetical protein